MCRQFTVDITFYFYLVLWSKTISLLSSLLSKNINFRFNNSSGFWWLTILTRLLTKCKLLFESASSQMKQYFIFNNWTIRPRLFWGAWFSFVIDHATNSNWKCFYFLMEKPLVPLPMLKVLSLNFSSKLILLQWDVIIISLRFEKYFMCLFRKTRNKIHHRCILWMFGVEDVRLKLSKIIKSALYYSPCFLSVQRFTRTLHHCAPVTAFPGDSYVVEYRDCTISHLNAASTVDVWTTMNVHSRWM